MKKTLLTLLFFLLSSTLYATQKFDSKDWGVGIILGEPIALSAIVRPTTESAIDFGLGYFWGRSFLIYSDYLYLFPGTSIANDTKLNLVPYVGLGGLLRMHNSHSEFQTSLHARVPLGLSLLVHKSSPLEFFIEFVPVVDLVPGLGMDLNGGIGFRIYL